MFLGHGEHSVAPAKAYFPGVQSRHAVALAAPVVLEYFPAAQSIALEAPVVLEYFPALQKLQEIEPSGAKVPGGQSPVHEELVIPGSAPHLPVEQFKPQPHPPFASACCTCRRGN